MKSKLGLALAGLYLLTAIYLIATQGLFGESFIALILGLPWVLALVLFEFGGGSGVWTYVMILTPIAINVGVFYMVGWLLGRVFSRNANTADTDSW